jgi:hypothetical protein
VRTNGIAGTPRGTGVLERRGSTLGGMGTPILAGRTATGAGLPIQLDLTDASPRLRIPRTPDMMASSSPAGGDGVRRSRRTMSNMGAQMMAVHEHLNAARARAAARGTLDRAATFSPQGLHPLTPAAAATAAATTPSLGISVDIDQASLPAANSGNTPTGGVAANTPMHIPRLGLGNLRGSINATHFHHGPLAGVIGSHHDDHGIHVPSTPVAAAATAAAHTASAVIGHHGPSSRASTQPGGFFLPPPHVHHATAVNTSVHDTTTVTTPLLAGNGTTPSDATNIPSASPINDAMVTTVPIIPTRRSDVDTIMTVDVHHNGHNHSHVPPAAPTTPVPASANGAHDMTLMSMTSPSTPLIDATRSPIVVSKRLAPISDNKTTTGGSGVGQREGQRDSYRPRSRTRDSFDVNGHAVASGETKSRLDWEASIDEQPSINDPLYALPPSSTTTTSAATGSLPAGTVTSPTPTHGLHALQSGHSHAHVSGISSHGHHIGSSGLPPLVTGFRFPAEHRDDPLLSASAAHTKSSANASSTLIVTNATPVGIGSGGRVISGNINDSKMIDDKHPPPTPSATAAHALTVEENDDEDNGDDDNDDQPDPFTTVYPHSLSLHHDILIWNCD